jgi:hypothetical protein
MPRTQPPEGPWLLGSTTPTPYQVRVQRSGVRPGVDLTALNRLADELEDDASIGVRDS